MITKIIMIMLMIMIKVMIMIMIVIRISIFEMIMIMIRIMIMIIIMMKMMLIYRKVRIIAVNCKTIHLDNCDHRGGCDIDNGRDNVHDDLINIMIKFFFSCSFVTKKSQRREQKKSYVQLS